MAPKSRKTEDKKAAAPAKKAEEPAAKKAKTDEEPAKPEDKEAAKEDEAAKEPEVDAADDKRAKLTDKVTFDVSDTTLNVVPMADGKMLSTLVDGGMQYLIAGARANVGLKSGRYFFEIRILEQMNPSEGHHNHKGDFKGHGKGAQVPRHLVRVGFSTAGSSLILGDGDIGGICFDSEGFFVVGNEQGRSERTRWMEKSQGKSRFHKDIVVGVLLNLDAKSANANTISLFNNGKRVSDSKPLPESMKGKTLFPHIAYRNTTIQVNWGASPLTALPFKCPLVGSAAKADVEVKKSSAPKDGKYEVLFPVGFPDEGTFFWLDDFLKKNPQYVELSDRKIIEWAKKSGCRRTHKGGFGSNDKPKADFGVQHLDDFSARRVVNSIASVVPRNYVVMEVKQNLLANDRKNNLKRFPGHAFKRVAKVVMGEPKAAFKTLVKDKILKDKQVKAEREWKNKQEEKARKKAAEQRKKEAEKKKAEEAEKKKKAEDEKKKKAEEEKAKKEGEKKEGEEKKEEEKKDEAPKEEEKKEEEKKEEEKKEEEAEKEEEEETEPPKVTLSEEEEKQWFVKFGTSDLNNQTLDSTYSNFSIPEKAEGFDSMDFEWETEKAAGEYLRKWILDRKRTTRIESLQPSAAFKTAAAAWKTKVGEWKAKQKEAKGKKKPDEEAAAAVKDVMGVEDILDIGNGTPLFLEFQDEDWALMALRWELFTLAKFYKEDVNDEDRVEIPEAHVTYYFNKYHHKQLLVKNFGKDSLAELCTIVKDTAVLEDSVFKTKLEADTEVEYFVKATEDSRRERQRRIDAGDETARLKITLTTVPAAPPPGGKGKGKK
eukprot:TRINITY_DN1261_c4_g1_i1.p1 TRINITY_DN1261_c4_g1~~TRINITY_DN1261_c4_g1_i1.p1  ORF type:complete len:824 (-),score=378.51 TRINITY_DN1261_c4_g1_i1:179-2650(-)